MSGHSNSHVLTGQALRDKSGCVDCQLSCYSDADLAGHSAVTSKSTSGIIVMLKTTKGEKTALFPLSWSSHKQSSTSSSTSEAKPLP
eukprot:3743456-Amphidinium_carterae.1